MLFGYRSGKYQPTLKAWRKLEAAERQAGLRDAAARQERPTPPAGQPDAPPKMAFADIQELNRQLYALREAQSEALRKIDALRRDQQQALDAYIRETDALRARLAELERPPGDTPAT
jgi:hypothetical protein